MPDTDHVSIIRWRSTETDPPIGPNREVLAQHGAQRGGRVEVLWSSYVASAPEHFTAWADLPSDQGLTVGDVVLLEKVVNDRIWRYIQAANRLESNFNLSGATDQRAKAERLKPIAKSLRAAVQ